MAAIQTLIKTLMTDTSLTYDAKVNALLNEGLSRFNMTMGIVSKIDGIRYEVMYCTDGELVGQVFRFGNTYCAITMQLENNRVLGVPHFSVSEFFRHPAYETFKLESYIGIPLIVNGSRYGTLNYTRPLPYEEAFTLDHYQMMTALSTAIGDLLGAKAKE